MRDGDTNDEYWMTCIACKSNLEHFYLVIKGVSGSQCVTAKGLFQGDTWIYFSLCK